MTVDEFREIWFQNAADPPAFAQPRLAIGDDAHGAEETSESEEPSSSRAENIQSQSVQGENTVTDAEAQSAFLEELVEDRALEEEINRHLTNNEFQQALAEMNGTFSFVIQINL